jgi:hypothetical protein
MQNWHDYAGLATLLIPLLAVGFLAWTSYKSDKKVEKAKKERLDEVERDMPWKKEEHEKLRQRKAAMPAKSIYGSHADLLGGTFS